MKHKLSNVHKQFIVEVVKDVFKQLRFESPWIKTFYMTFSIKNSHYTFNKKTNFQNDSNFMNLLVSIGVKFTPRGK